MLVVQGEDSVLCIEPALAGKFNHNFAASVTVAYNKEKIMDSEVVKMHMIHTLRIQQTKGNLIS